MSQIKPAPRQPTVAVSSQKPENNNTVGKNYGSRAANLLTKGQNPNPASNNSGKSRFLSDAAKQEALEKFAASDQFKRGSRVGSTAHQTPKMYSIEKGLSTPLAAKGASPDDVSCLEFLNNVIETEALHSTRALRNHLLTRTPTLSKAPPKKIIS